MLLAETPRQMVEMKPFFLWLQDPPRIFHWGIPRMKMQGLLDSRCHDDMYQYIRTHSPVMNGELVLDKTPRYIYRLRQVMARAPGTPVVVMTKAREALWQSWHRRNVPPKHFAKKWAVAQKALDTAKTLYPGRILVVEYDKFLASPETEARRVFDFLDLDWKDEYLTLDALNDKWQRVFDRESKPLMAGLTPSLKYPNAINGHRSGRRCRLRTAATVGGRKGRGAWNETSHSTGDKST